MASSVSLPVALFSSQHFLPHSHSFAWTPGVLWLNVVPDILITLASLTVAFGLLHMARRRPDLPFNALFTWLGLFLVGCGLVQVMNVWNLWHATYWLAGVVKLITAAAAIATLILLWRAMPALIALPSPLQLQQAHESLGRANRELEAFTASVSHDLRSPLSAIAGQAGLLELSLAEQATEDQQRRLQRIQGSVKHMSELIEALLTLSRISRQALKPEPVDVTGLANEVVAALRGQDPARAVQVTIQPGMTAQADRHLLGTVLANLIGNAWKFTSKTPAASIEVGVTRDESATTLHVRDNGAGFDMAYQQKLFKPFQRLHGAAEFTGSGIGLATVQRIIERHGGKVWGQGEPGQGAVFYCSLPEAQTQKN